MANSLEVDWQAVASVVFDGGVADAVESLDLPHVALVFDPYLDTTEVWGPFPTPVEAAAFADWFQTELCYGDYTEPVSICLRPLHPGDP